MHRTIASRAAVAAGLALAIVTLTAAPAFGLPSPSKTADGQSLAEREAQLAAVRGFLEHPELADALAAHGLERDEIQSRLAQLSPEELESFSGQVEQLQAAGARVPQYIWILLAVLLGVLIVAAIA